MPDIVSDIVDVYVFRRLNARVQFLLLQRKATVPLGNTWQSFHTQIQAHESTVVAAGDSTHSGLRVVSGIGSRGRLLRNQPLAGGWNAVGVHAGDRNRWGRSTELGRRDGSGRLWGTALNDD